MKSLEHPYFVYISSMNAITIRKMSYQTQKMEDNKKSLAPANSVSNFNVILIAITQNGMKILRPSPVLIMFYGRLAPAFMGTGLGVIPSCPSNVRGIASINIICKVWWPLLISKCAEANNRRGTAKMNSKGIAYRGKGMDVKAAEIYDWVTLTWVQKSWLYCLPCWEKLKRTGLHFGRL